MTDHVKKMIFAKCLEIGCHTLFQNHLYIMKKRVFKQVKGSGDHEEGNDEVRDLLQVS